MIYPPPPPQHSRVTNTTPLAALQPSLACHRALLHGDTLPLHSSRLSSALLLPTTRPLCCLPPLSHLTPLCPEACCLVYQSSHFLSSSCVLPDSRCKSHASLLFPPHDLTTVMQQKHTHVLQSLSSIFTSDSPCASPRGAMQGIKNIMVNKMWKN